MGNRGFIGVFDSGVGGISVLRSLVSELPHEDFRYFGDSANAPYGDKDVLSIRSLSEAIVDRFVADGAKAVVIACNTATSASAEYLRDKYPDLPIIGVEPALKPAAAAAPHARVLVMATAATLKLEKFQRLVEEWAGDSDLVCVPCVGLAELVETGDFDSPEVHDLLERALGPYRGQVDSVVLGCTHYPFVKRQIAEVLGSDVRFFDGGEGAAHQCRRLLESHGLLADSDAAGSVEFASSVSTPGELALLRRLFNA